MIKDKPKRCAYCKRNPGAKEYNPALWNGFYDKDTNQFVCLAPPKTGLSCRARHYRRKAKTKFRGQYTEFPVVMDVQ